MNFPSLSEINQADRIQICRWYRFLPSGVTEDERKIQDHIYKKFQDFGGFTPEISKRIGWSE